MTKYFCDICGEEIAFFDKQTRYKFQRKSEFFDNQWETLDVHKDCWNAICRTIRNNRQKNK